jgi:hypothetical protein
MKTATGFYSGRNMDGSVSWAQRDFLFARA